LWEKRCQSGEQLDIDKPVIVTQRLTLQPHTLNDVDDVFAMRSDPELTRFLGGVMNREDVRSRVLRNIGLWAAVDLGYWVARETDTSRFVGEFGFADYHRDTTPSFAGIPEVGWVAAAWAQRKGFTSEAVEAILAWGDRQATFDRTVCMISKNNLPSLRVAEKFGYRQFSDVFYKGNTDLLFERLRPT